MAKVSVLIPAREEPYLLKTVADVLSKASGDIEIIVVFDGCQRIALPGNDRVIVQHNHESVGTRKAVNDAARLATGEYLLKLDAHCMMSEGFDEVLTADHVDPTWVVTFPRYSLDPETWMRGYGPIIYEYPIYPLPPGATHVGAMTPKKWLGPDGLGDRGKESYYWLERQRENHVIDEISTCLGDCWFMRRDRFLDWGGFDEQFAGMQSDNVEMSFKAWLSGGQLMIDKRAYHAHWWKSRANRTVPLDWKSIRLTQWQMTWYLSHDQWPKATRTFKWFVEHFWPIPGWPEDWERDFAALQKP